MQEGPSMCARSLGKGSSLVALGLLVIVVALGPAACKSQKDKPSKGEQSAIDSAREALASAPAAIDAALAEMHPPRVKVDGEKLKAITLSDDFELLSLTQLPPIEDWKILIVHSIEEREFRATKPSLLTGQRTMKIVKQADASYEFLVMQLEGEGQSVRHRMPRVKVIEIQTHDYVPPAPAKERASLTISVDGQKRELGPDKLEKIKRTPEPGAEKERDTWLLLDMLEIKTLDGQQSIVLHAAGDKSLTLTKQMLQDKTRLHLIKRNRRGQFHYRDWRLSIPPIQSTELRGLRRIELR